MPTIDTAGDGTVRRFANPFVAAERGYIDEVIMLHSTRKRVARALRRRLVTLSRRLSPRLAVLR